MKCKFLKQCQYAKILGSCCADDGKHCECYEPSPTNADRIRSMSDEELADILEADFTAEKIPFCKNKPECNAMLESDTEIPESMCKACMLVWLRQPANEEEKSCHT